MQGCTAQFVVEGDFLEGFASGRARELRQQHDGCLDQLCELGCAELSTDRTSA